MAITGFVAGTIDTSSFCVIDGFSPLDPASIVRDGADAHLLVAAGRSAARCSLWWAATPRCAAPAAGIGSAGTRWGSRVGLIGHYEANDANASQTLLVAACKRLAVEGCTMAVGPVDGSTHRRYRLITERGTEPPFFLEPDNPDAYPAYFAAAGFTVLASYYSLLDSRMGAGDPRLPAIARSLAGRGVRIRMLEIEHFSSELRRIYPLVRTSFAGNFLYSPIEEQELVVQYMPLQPYVQPELALIAEQDGHPVGFVFAVPDLCQAQRGEPIDTAVIKTLAVQPGVAFRGLGALLGSMTLQHMRELGYRRVIHALLHERNGSVRGSSRYQTRIFRKYAVFARGLAVPA